MLSLTLMQNTFVSYTKNNTYKIHLVSMNLLQQLHQ